MRLVGVGVDVIDVSRLNTTRGKYQKTDVTELYGAKLLAADPFLARFAYPYEVVGGASELFVAKLWTGKEAVAKTLGTGFWQRGVAWDDIRIGPDFVVRFAGTAATIAGGDQFTIEYSQIGDSMVALAHRYTSTSTSDSGLR